MKELIAALPLNKGDNLRKQVSKIVVAMHKIVAEKNEMDFENPVHDMLQLLLKIMGTMNYPITGLV